MTLKRLLAAIAVGFSIALIVIAVAIFALVPHAHAQIYSPITNFVGPGAGAQFRQAVNDRFSGVQPITPAVGKVTFSTLSSTPEADGALLFCINCSTTTPCSIGSGGTFAFGQGGVWSCGTGGSPLPGTVVQTNQSNTYSAGPQSLGTQALTVQIPNAASTGTTINKLAKLTGAGTAVITTTSDTSGAIGIVVAGSGTTGSADIAREGRASCAFDGATTQNDYVANSNVTGGDCADAGSTALTGFQCLGRVLSTNGGAGTYTVLVGSCGPAVGTAAAANLGTSGATVGLLNGNLTFGGTDTFSTGPAMSGANISSATIPSAALVSTAVTPGSYTSTDLTVNQQGQITAAANGAGSVAIGATVQNFTSQTIATGGSNVAVLFPACCTPNNPVDDTGSFYSSSFTTRLTAPTSSRYVATLTVHWSGFTGNQRRMYMCKNGSCTSAAQLCAASIDAVAASNDPTQSCSWNGPLSATDYIEGYVFQDTGSNQALTSSWMSITRIGH